MHFSFKRPRRSTSGFEPWIVFLLDKHHNHLNQKSALTFGSSEYGAYLINAQSEAYNLLTSGLI